MDVEEVEARMSKRDTFSEQDWPQESILEIKYRHDLSLFKCLKGA